MFENTERNIMWLLYDPTLPLLNQVESGKFSRVSAVSLRTAGAWRSASGQRKRRNAGAWLIASERHRRPALTYNKQNLDIASKDFMTWHLEQHAHALKKLPATINRCARALGILTHQCKSCI